MSEELLTTDDQSKCFLELEATRGEDTVNTVAITLTVLRLLHKVNRLNSGIPILREVSIVR